MWYIKDFKCFHNQKEKVMCRDGDVNLLDYSNHFTMCMYIKHVVHLKYMQFLVYAKKFILYLSTRSQKEKNQKINKLYGTGTYHSYCTGKQMKWMLYRLCMENKCIKK